MPTRPDASAPAGPWLLAARGQRPRVAADVWLAPTATLIGDVEVGALSSVWFGCVLRGDVHHIRIGERSNVQDGTILHVTRERFPTLVGSDVTIGHGCVVHGCEVGDGAFIGIRATVMDGAVVEPRAMVAAGALVAPGRVVPTGELWAGVPARRLRSLTDEDLAEFEDISAHYVALSREYLEASLA